MATAAASKSVHDDATSEVYETADRIKSLRAEGNLDGATELSKEAEKIISALKGSGAVSLRKTLRAAVAEAMKVEPTVESSTEIEVAPKAEVIADESELDTLVGLGAEQVQNISNNKVNGAKQLAQLMLDIRRRITLPDGTPDIMGTSPIARRKSREIYKRVLDSLPAKGESEHFDTVRKEVEKLQKDVQNMARDARVAYARALDNEGSEDERAKFPFLDADSDVPVSEQVAEHYGFRLATIAELSKANREAKALESGKDEPKDESAPSSPTAMLDGAVDTVRKAISSLTETDFAELHKAVVAAGTEYKDGVLAELNTHISALQSLVTLIEA